MKTTNQKNCRGGRSHDDAMTLVEYLIASGGKSGKSNDDIAHDLGFVKVLGGGLRQPDTSRFVQARNHVKDNIAAVGGACTGFDLNYRKSGRAKSELVLIDPKGGTSVYAESTLENLRGWLSRESQHQTENLRQITAFETLRDQALAVGDKVGATVCIAAAIDLSRIGTVAPTTMADLTLWVDSLRAAGTPSVTTVSKP